MVYPVKGDFQKSDTSQGHASFLLPTNAKIGSEASFEDCLTDAKRGYETPDDRFDKFSRVLSKAEDIGAMFSIRAFIRDCFFRGKNPQTIGDLVEIAKADADQVHYTLSTLLEIEETLKEAPVEKIPYRDFTQRLKLALLDAITERTGEQFSATVVQGDSPYIRIESADGRGSAFSEPAFVSEAYADYPSRAADGLPP